MSLSIYLDINRGSDVGDLYIARDMSLDYSWRLDNSQGHSFVYTVILFNQGWYFRFDDDDNMSYGYIRTMTYTEMGQLNTHNHIYINVNTDVGTPINPRPP